MTATADVLTQIIRDKFEIDPGRIKPDATLQDIGIDSLDVFDLVFTVEEVLDIKVPSDDLKIGSFQDLVDLIDRIRRARGRA